MKKINNPAIDMDAYIPAEKFVFRGDKSSKGVPKEAYSNWYRKLLWLLEEVASEEFQERVWVNADGPEVSSYSEVIAQYFDDLFLEEGLEKICKQKYLSKKEVSILKSFDDAFRKFIRSVEDPNRLDILNSKEWKDIISLAGETLRKLKKNDRK